VSGDALDLAQTAAFLQETENAPLLLDSQRVHAERLRRAGSPRLPPGGRF
jgi:hypothetical protein